MTDPLKHQLQTAAGIGYAEGDPKVKNHAAALERVYAALGVEAADVQRVVANVVRAIPDPVTAAIETLRENTYRLTEAHRQALLEIVEEAAEPTRDMEDFPRGARRDEFDQRGADAEHARVDTDERGRAVRGA